MTARDLRLIVNSRCNYSCFYCHREGLVGTYRELLDPTDYFFIFKTIKDLVGVNKVEITGGEPLLRNDLHEIIKLLKGNDTTLKLITNGSYIKNKIQTVMMFDLIYVSIASMDENKYRNIHGIHNLLEVKSNIEMLAKMKKNISINVALANSLNSEEITTFLDFGISIGVNVRFLEIQTPKVSDKFIFPKDKIISELVRRKYKVIRSMSRLDEYLLNKSRVSFVQYYCPAETSSENKINSHCFNNHGFIFTPSGQLMVCREDQSRNVNLLSLIKQRKEREFCGKIKEAIDMFGKNCVRYNKDVISNC